MAQPAQQVEYGVTIANEVYLFEDPIITGRDILEALGRRPASSYLIVAYLGGGTQSIGLDEKLDISVDSVPELRVFKGDRLFRATLNEREVVWGKGQVSAAELRFIGNLTDDEDLYYDSDGDREISDDETLSLKGNGTERFRSGPPQDRTVEVILNGEITTVDKGRLSFSDLAKLAFPKLFGGELICFTVSFSRGPKRRPEGVLLDGGGIRVVEGMIFNVSATDKS